MDNIEGESDVTKPQDVRLQICYNCESCIDYFEQTKDDGVTKLVLSLGLGEETLYGNLQNFTKVVSDIHEETAPEIELIPELSLDRGSNVDSILHLSDEYFCMNFYKSIDICGNEFAQPIKRGKHKEGIYHIQHINTFHSKLKKWMDRFNGVSTKYLSNYMYWFKWLQLFDIEKDTIKSKHLMVQAHTSHCDTKLMGFKMRKPVFV